MGSIDFSLVGDRSVRFEPSLKISRVVWVIGVAGFFSGEDFTFGRCASTS